MHVHQQVLESSKNFEGAVHLCYIYLRPRISLTGLQAGAPFYFLELHTLTLVARSYALLARLILL